MPAVPTTAYAAVANQLSGSEGSATKPSVFKAPAAGKAAAARSTTVTMANFSNLIEHILLRPLPGG